MGELDDLRELVRRRDLALSWGRAHRRRRAAAEARLARKRVEENLTAHLTEARSGRFGHPDEPEAEGGLGVREPRRPKPSGSSDATALPEPDSGEAP